MILARRAGVRRLFFPGGVPWRMWVSLPAVLGRTDAFCVGAVFVGSRLFFSGIRLGGEGDAGDVWTHLASTSFLALSQTTRRIFVSVIVASRVDGGACLVCLLCGHGPCC
ncbi:hypothetical protein B0H17DRAFT_1113658, partial [Mycena rosella]